MAFELKKASDDQVVSSETPEYFQLKKVASSRELAELPPPPPYSSTLPSGGVASQAWQRPPGPDVSTFGLRQASGPRFPAPGGGHFQPPQGINRPQFTQQTSGVSQFSPGIQQSSGVSQFSPGAQQSSRVSQFSAGAQQSSGLRQFSSGAQQSSGVSQFSPDTQQSSRVSQFSPGAQQSSGVSQFSPGAQRSAGVSQFSPGAQRSAGVSQFSPDTQQSSGVSQISPGAQQQSGVSQFSPGAQQPSGVSQFPPGVQQPSGGPQFSPGTQQTLGVTQFPPTAQQTSRVPRFAPGAQQALGVPRFSPGSQQTPGVLQFPSGTQQSSGVLHFSPGAQQSSGVSQISPGAQQSSRVSQFSPGAQQSSGGSQFSPGAQQSSGVSQFSPGAQQSSGVSQFSPGAKQSSGVSQFSPGAQQTSGVSQFPSGVQQTSGVSQFSPGAQQSSGVSQFPSGAQQTSGVSQFSPGAKQPSRVSQFSPGVQQTSGLSQLPSSAIFPGFAPRGGPSVQHMQRGSAPQPSAPPPTGGTDVSRHQAPPRAFHNLPPVFQSQPQAPNQHTARPARPRGVRQRRPRLNFSALGRGRGGRGNFSNLPYSSTQKTENTVSQAPTTAYNPVPSLSTLAGDSTEEALLSPSTPAFIDTDFNKDLFAEAEQQLAEMQTSHTPLPDLSEIMDLSTSGELPITSPSPMQPSFTSQPQLYPQALNQNQSMVHSQTASGQQLIQNPQSQSQPRAAAPIQLQAQNTVRTPTGTLVGQNLIVQQYPLQSVSSQHIIPLTGQPQFTQAQLSQAHGGLAQSPNVVQGQMLRASLPQQQMLQGSLAQASMAQTQIAAGQMRLPVTHVRLPLTHMRLPQGAIRLSQSGTPVSLNQAQLSTARALSPGQALSLIPQQQMAGVSLSLTSAQTVLGQTQPGIVTMASGAHTQATFINMNPSLAGATLISQPIQMLTTSGYQQMVSTPVQLTAGQGGQAVLMPFQQSASVLNPASVSQVFNSTLTSKSIQPRPSAVLTMPTPGVQHQGTKIKHLVGGTNTAGITTLPSTAISASPITIPVNSLAGVVSTAQVATSIGQSPRTGAPCLPNQQVLNIPQLRLARPGGQFQALRMSGTTDPRHTFVLQQPMRSPPDRAAAALPQIRPREKHPLRSGETKIVAIQPQGQHRPQMQVLQQAGQSQGAVLLTSPNTVGLGGSRSNFTPVTTGSDTQLRIPTCVTSPLRITQRASGEDVPLNLDTKMTTNVPVTSSQTVPANTQSSKQLLTPNSNGAPNGLSPKASIREEESTAVKDENANSTSSTMPDPTEDDDPDFVWEDYLEETNTEAAPPTSFIHVESSLESGIQKGMVVEVSRNVAADAYWLATIVMTCGPLLRLRYAGYEEGAQDFWLDVGSPDMHPVGWGADSNRKPQPPEGLREKILDWEGYVKEKLTTATVVPGYLLDSNHGVTPVDQIKPGQRLEVQHELAPGSVWVVRILENVGGRLLLRYEGTDRASHDRWLFYLHYSLHPIGWAKENDCIYKPPEEILAEHQNYSEWSEILQAALKEASTNVLPPAVFKDQEKIEAHKFQQGWKLEALHPHQSFQICPATIHRVVGKYIIVEIDSVLPEDGTNKKMQFCCHGKSPRIFPSGWSQSNGVRLTPPTGWKKQDFDWETYLKERNATAAPESAFITEWPELEFSRNMKLEAVNPAQAGQICAATITRIIGHLLWIHLDSCAKIMANHIVPITSQEIFPVGWCASNGYPLKPPRKSCFRKPGKKVAVVQPDRRAESLMSADEYRNATYSQIKAGDGGSSWCPKIYFNHKCFSGPFLSKGRIAELPRCVGPGPIPLVLKEVLSMLINVAYKSSRVLRELQQEGPPDPTMQTQTLKAKYKGKSYCAVVELCRTTGQIEQFCRSACLKLECCPNLFSANFVNGNCPENCSQLTKTKYTCYYGKKKKRKIGRPPGGHSNLENGPIKFGRRRRKRRMNLIMRKKSSTADRSAFQNGNQGDHDDVFEDDKSSRSTDTHSSLGQNDHDSDFSLAKKKRKYEHRILPPSIIKTRGAKLPRYSFERRTHKKIMLSPPPAGRNRAPQHTSAIVMSPKKEPLYNEEEIPKLETNPLYWTVMDVVQFIKTTDCAHLARLFRDQAIDGQALLLLTLPAVQDHLDLKLGPAIKLCHHIEQVKIAFYEQFAK